MQASVVRGPSDQRCGRIQHDDRVRRQGARHRQDAQRPRRRATPRLLHHQGAAGRRVLAHGGRRRAGRGAAVLLRAGLVRGWERRAPRPAARRRAQPRRRHAPRARGERQRRHQHHRGGRRPGARQRARGRAGADADAHAAADDGPGGGGRRPREPHLGRRPGSPARGAGEPRGARAARRRARPRLAGAAGAPRRDRPLPAAGGVLRGQVRRRFPRGPVRPRLRARVHRPAPGGARGDDARLGRLRDGRAHRSRAVRGARRSRRAARDAGATRSRGRRCSPGRPPQLSRPAAPPARAPRTQSADRRPLRCL